MTTPKSPIQPEQSKKQSCVTRTIRKSDLLKFHRWFKVLKKVINQAEVWVGDNKQYDSMQKTIKDILYRIDLLLEEVRDDLLKYAKVEKSLFAKDIKEEIIDKWDSIDKKQFLDEVKFAITVLDNVPKVIERNKLYGIKIPEPAKTEKDNNLLEKGRDGEAFIPFGKAIQFSNGILTRKRLEKAIKKGIPLKVRDRKPRKQRLEVHIQDLMSLIEKLSSNAKVSEEVALMFGTYVKEYQKKRNENINLD